MSKENRIVELLEELVYWTKEATVPEIRQRLLTNLESPEEKTAYELSDGKKTTRQVASKVKVGKDTVAKWWNNWIAVGIAEPIPTKGGGHRAKRKFLLKDFGIEVPKIAKTSIKRQGRKASDKQNSDGKAS